MAQNNIRSFRYNDITKKHLKKYDNSLDRLVYAAFIELEANADELQRIKQEYDELVQKVFELNAEVQSLNEQKEQIISLARLISYRYKL